MTILRGLFCDASEPRPLPMPQPPAIRPSILRQLRPTGVLLLVLFLGSQPGCVHRRMTIRTNPPGAVAYVDDYEIGTTPVSTDFTYYGTRKVRLVKDGCETLTVMQPIRAPWYEITPLDFVFENLWPCEIKDHRALDYQLTPQMVVPTEQLLERAEGLRARSHASQAPEVAPLPDIAPPPAEAIPPGTPVPGLMPPDLPDPGGYPVHPLPR